MRMRHVSIRNFRSIREMGIDCQPLMIFIGPNNHGKSNVLLALDFFFDAGKKLALDDFFAHRDPPDAPIIVEVEFDELSTQDKTTFKKYMLGADRLKVQKIARTQGDGSVSEYHGYIELAEESWLNPDRASDYTTRDAISDLPAAFKALLPPSGRISRSQVEEAQQRYTADYHGELRLRVQPEQGPFMGPRAVAAGILGDYHLLPAVRDIADETKVQGTTSFGRLLTNAVREMTERNDDFRRIRDELMQLIGSLNRLPDGTDEGRPQELVELEKSLCHELRDWGISLDIEITPPEIERLFQLGTNVFMDDGVRTTVHTKGHGLQRCFLLALFKAWAATLNKLRAAEASQPETSDRPARRASTQSLFFAIEEPELFLHPQAQRQMLALLKDLAAAPNHQVLLCTHSSFFVDMQDYRSICIITKPDAIQGTKPLQCCSELFSGDASSDRKRRFNMAYWFNPDRSELFFARRVVLVEGATEKTVIPFLASKLGIVQHDVTVVDCGGKFNLALYATVLNAFRLNYVILHDLDPVAVPEGHEDYQKQTHAFGENKRIEEAIDATCGCRFVFEPDFERLAGISVRAGEKQGKPLAALEHFADQAVAIPSAMEQAVRLAYAA